MTSKRGFFRPLAIAGSVLTITVLVLAGIFYTMFLPGLSVARIEPSAFETNIATWLLTNSIPEEDRRAVNPLGDDLANVSAGRDLFQQKCEVCHAYDGSGTTEMGRGQFPRPPALRTMNVASKSDGEIFYHIRNGIRNTGMPAWDMPDEEIWQLVSFIRDLPMVAPIDLDPIVVAQKDAISSANHVGSGACQSCHEDIYSRWSESRMANVVRDPREHPDAIIPDFSIPDPLLTFTEDEIAFVYGSGWKQRYFARVGDDYFPFPAQWDITNEEWRPYHVAEGAEWWTEHYPADNSQRPTGPLCDGCHSVNYDIATKTVSEWNVGCERCHGAGSTHVDEPVRSNILNPALLNYVEANDTCIQCHSQGQPLSNPIEGTYYDWPVGFHMGLDLVDFWKLEEHELGEETNTHFPEGTAHKNRMQGNDYVQSLMYERGVTCSSCHDPHGSEFEASLRMPANEVCMSCHAPNSQNGPRAASIEEHTHHEPGSTGSQCVACHMPKIARTISNVNVSSHTFNFVTPNETEHLNIPNACNVCHTDETNEWATSALQTWSDRSPWRMAP
jgi:predicted CXXCH cytochrome family protein